MTLQMHTSGLAAALLMMASAAMFGQSIQGEVRDSQGRPVAGATVELRIKATGQTFTARSDSQGNYRVSALPPGSYSVRAQASEAGETVAGPFDLSDKETKKLDLTLQFAFSDQPNFIVAGVTDTMSHGGHGSDTVLRSTEALAKATVSLSAESANVPGTEKSLRRAIERAPADAALHHALADFAEKQGNALEAVREYQRAAELDPNETNLFDWGAELLKHRAAAPATDVFAKGHRTFSRSLRMVLGLAAAYYARGSYDQAARFFFEACDLSPGSPEPYMFLGRVQASEITQLDGYVERMRRFAARYPENAWADYYYAVSLWNQRQDPEDTGTPKQVRELLEKAVRIDPGLGVAYLQIGIAYSASNDQARAIAAYRKAIEISPSLEEAHYRLGQAYGRIGEQEKARKELEIYEQAVRKSVQEADRERAEIRQFVIELRDAPSAAPVQ